MKFFFDEIEKEILLKLFQTTRFLLIYASFSDKYEG